MAFSPRYRGLLCRSRKVRTAKGNTPVNDREAGSRLQKVPQKITTLFKGKGENVG